MPEDPQTLAAALAHVATCADCQKWLDDTTLTPRSDA